jgi:hypothetical protein
MHGGGQGGTGVEMTAMEVAWHRGGCRGGGAEKKTSVSASGDRDFAIHRCGGDDRADDAVPGCGDGIDLTTVEAVREAMVWTQWWWRRVGGGGVDSAVSRSTHEILVAYRRQVHILQLGFKERAAGAFIGGP